MQSATPQDAIGERRESTQSLRHPLVARVSQ